MTIPPMEKTGRFCPASAQTDHAQTDHAQSAQDSGSGSGSGYRCSVSSNGFPLPKRHHGRMVSSATLLLAGLFGMGMIAAVSGVLTAQETKSNSRPTVAAVAYSDHQNLMYYLDETLQKKDVKTLADWEIRRGHLLRNMQVAMGELPPESRRCPLDVRIVDTVKLPGMLRHKLSYASEPGDRVPAYLFVPTTRSIKRAAVLCLHQTTNIGKDEPAGLGGNPNLHYALHLAQRGFVTLAPDYPSFGEHVYDFAAHPEYRSGSMKAIWDNIRAVDVLETLPEVDANKIGVIGHSLGGHNAMFTAVFEPRIKVIVSNCGFTRFHKYYGGKLAGWTSPRYMPLIATAFENDPNRVPFDFPEIVGSFAPRAFLASAPERDDNFEVSGVKDSMESALPVFQLFGKTDNLQANYPSCAHDFPSEARQTAYRFMERNLR